MTWLYGPLHGNATADPPVKVSSTADRLGIDAPSGKKSILKQRTLTDILHSSIDLAGLNKSHEADPVKRGSIMKNPPSRLKNKTLNLGALPSSSKPTSKGKERHISFNTTVEQRIVVEDDRGVSYFDDGSDASDSDYSEEYAIDEVDDHSESMVSSAHINQSNKHRAFKNRRSTIAYMEPTRLKMGHDYIEKSGTAFSSFADSDDEQYGELDSRYSVDDVPAAQEFAFDHDYDYESDDGIAGQSPPS